MKFLAVLLFASIITLTPAAAEQPPAQSRDALSNQFAQITVPPGGARPPGGTIPPGGMPRDRRAECRQRCLNNWETARQACIALQGAVVVRDCLEQILATRDACVASC